MPPKKIKVVSDGNELEYQTTITPTKSKQSFITYKYVKSESKMDRLIGWTEEEFNILFKNKTIIEA